VLIVGLRSSAMPKQITVDSEHDVVTIDGHRVPGWISETGRCGTCGASKIYHADHGALFFVQSAMFGPRECAGSNLARSATIGRACRCLSRAWLRHEGVRAGCPEARRTGSRAIGLRVRRRRSSRLGQTDCPGGGQADLSGAEPVLPDGPA